jgi:hypothetical protein
VPPRRAGDIVVAAMASKTRVLAVANRTADSEELHAVLVERREQGPIAVTLLVPATWEISDPHGGRESARRRTRAAIDRLAESDIEVECTIGEADPVAAVAAIWDPERFDEVIVATLPKQLSRWLRIDLPHRVEKITGRPVRHVIAHERAGPTPAPASGGAG